MLWLHNVSLYVRALIDGIMNLNFPKIILSIAMIVFETVLEIFDRLHLYAVENFLINKLKYLYWKAKVLS